MINSDISQKIVTKRNLLNNGSVKIAQGIIDKIYVMAFIVFMFP